MNNYCLKNSSCSAPICPLDNHWKARTHIKDEPICFYLLEHSKTSNGLKNQGDIEGKLFEGIQRHSSGIKNAHKDINKRLERSSNTNSRLKIMGVN